MYDFLLEDYIFFQEEINILIQENIILDLKNKLSSMSITDMKNKILDKKNKAENKLEQIGFSKKEIKKITYKIANKLKKDLHFKNLNDVNNKQAKIFIKKTSNLVKHELKDFNIKNRFNEISLISTTIILFIFAIFGTIILIMTVSGILLIPLYWFIILCMYQLSVDKYMKEYYD